MILELLFVKFSGVPEVLFMNKSVYNVKPDMVWVLFFTLGEIIIIIIIIIKVKFQFQVNCNKKKI